MIDTHTHLYMPEFDDVDGSAASMAGQCAAVDRALATGVEMMILPNVYVATIEPLKTLHCLRPDVTAMAMGLHPTELDSDWRNTLMPIEAELRAGGYCAIGEVGIDLYWDKTYERQQMEAFDAQLGIASELRLPVIIHCREGLDHTLEVLSSHRDVQAVFHSFGGSPADVERILSAGDFFFGINGIVTFKNANLKHVLPAIPVDRILTETDAPYLAPVPYRGRRNESAYMTNTLAAIADAVDMSVADVDHITSQNARRFFHL